MALLTNSAGTRIAEVDANSSLVATGPQTPGYAGFAALVTEGDSGTITGARDTTALEGSLDYRLRVGADNPLLSERFPGTVLNSSVWSAPVSNMTVTLAGGFAILNTTALTSVTSVARLTSYRNFPVMGTSATCFEALVQFSQTPQANNTCEWGLLYASAISVPTDGAFFRLNSSGNFVCVVSYNGTESTSSALSFTSLVGVNTTRHFIVELHDDNVRFWVDDVLVWSSVRAVASCSPTMLQDLPACFRVYNASGAGPTSAQVMRVGAVSVVAGDLNLVRPWGAAQAGAGGTCFQTPTGQTPTSTAAYINNSAPSAATPANTAANLGVGLGGQFWETDTLAVTTDGIISSYQNPANTSTYSGKTLFITGCHVDSFVQTMIVGGGYVAQWCIAFGHNAVSLATTESSTAKAPRRVPLGIQAVAANAALSAKLDSMDVSFVDAPIAVLPGEYIQLVKRKVGTVPTSGVVAHLIRFTGYWE